MISFFGLWVLGKRSYKSPALRRALGVTRVIAYGTVVAAGLGAFAARTAVADVSEGSLRVGRDLEKLKDLLGKTNEITLNGEKIYYSQASSTDSVGAVLNRFQANCDDDPAMEGVNWQDLATIKTNPSKALGPTKLGVMRTEGNEDGVVLCFRRGEGAESKTFTKALSEFSSSKDLGAVGDLRYVHAAKSGTGTSIQVAWTHGSFKMGNIFPPTDGKDTPGSDSTILPRPDHSQRIMTATAAGTPYTARMYVTADGPDAALASYDAKMDAAGWAIIAPPVDPQTGAKGHWFERSGAQAMISTSRNTEGQTVVVVGDLGVFDEKAPSVEVQP